MTSSWVWVQPSATLSPILKANTALRDWEKTTTNACLMFKGISVVLREQVAVLSRFGVHQSLLGFTKALSLYPLKFNWANTSAFLHLRMAVFGFNVTHASFKTHFDWHLESQFHNTFYYISCVRDQVSPAKRLWCFPRGNEEIDNRQIDTKRPLKHIKYPALPLRPS